jgi:glycosyltransferase involved in cell wall biosynthesis
MNVMMISSLNQKCGVAEYTFALREALDSHATVRIMPIPPLKSRRGMKQIAEQINEADVAHIQYHPEFLGFWRNPRMVHQFCFLLKKVRIPSVVSVHDLTHRLPFQKMSGIHLKKFIYNFGVVPLVNWTPYGRFLLGRFLRVADHIIVHTTASQNFLQSLGIDERNISLLYPGIPEMMPSSKDSFPEEHGRKDRKWITVFGFITPMKGYEIVLKALRHLPHNVALLIAGGLRVKSDLSYYESLRAEIISLGLEERVRVTDHLEHDKVGAILGKSDIIILPYRSTAMTGVSYALSYAIASQRPVIASDTTFFREIEQKYGAIRIFKNEDPEDLAEAITEALRDPDNRRAEADRYRETWSWKNVADKTYGIYQRVLLKRSSSLRGD